MAEFSMKLEPSAADDDNVYYPGQKLNGTVKLSLNSSKDVNGLYILITGIAKCRWYERNQFSYCSTYSYKRYEGKEVYMNSKIFLIGSENSKRPKTPAGRNVYTFEYNLPTSLPESLKHGYKVFWVGKIEYKIEAVLDMPWRFNKKICIPFTIKRNDNHNTFPPLSKAVQLLSSCEGGKCEMRATILQSAFAVGQEIPIKIDYKNLSNVDVKEIAVKLIQEKNVTSFTPKTIVKPYEKTTEKKLRLDGVKSGASLMNREVFISIPSDITHSNERFCKVVTVKHTLEVRGIKSWYKKDLLIEFPITIF